MPPATSRMPYGYLFQFCTIRENRCSEIATSVSLYGGHPPEAMGEPCGRVAGWPGRTVPARITPHNMRRLARFENRSVLVPDPLIWVVA